MAIAIWVSDNGTTAHYTANSDNGAVSLSYSYNAANQVLSETTQLTGQPALTVGFAYDAAGRLASTTYLGGDVVAQTYTPLCFSILWSLLV